VVDFPDGVSVEELKFAWNCAAALDSDAAAFPDGCLASLDTLQCVPDSRVRISNSYTASC
jgi:hypothetical protein